MIQYSLIQRSKWLYRTELLWIMRINCIKFKISSCVTTNAFQGCHDSHLEGSRSMTMEFSFHWPYLRAIKMGFFTLLIRWCFPGARGQEETPDQQPLGAWTGFPTEGSPLARAVMRNHGQLPEAASHTESHQDWGVYSVTRLSHLNGARWEGRVKRRTKMVRKWSGQRFKGKIGRQSLEGRLCLDQESPEKLEVGTVTSGLREGSCWSADRERTMPTATWVTSEGGGQINSKVPFSPLGVWWQGDDKEEQCRLADQLC